MPAKVGCSPLLGSYIGQIINSRPQNFTRLVNGGGSNKNGGLEKISKICNRGRRLFGTLE